MSAQESKSKGPRMTFIPAGARYPGVVYLESGRGHRILYIRYVSKSDGKQHFERVGVWGQGEDKWTPSKASAERAARIRGDAKPNVAIREEATAAAEAKARALEEGTVTDETTLEQYATKWLERRKADLSYSNHRDYTSAFKAHIFPAIGKIPLQQITYRILDDFAQGMVDIPGRKENKSLSGKRRNNLMVPLKAMFNDAVRREDLLKNPAENVKRAKEEEPEIDPLSFPEMKTFLAKVDPRYLAYFTAAFLTGARPSELTALKWRNVDLENGVIIIREGRVAGREARPKTKSSNRDIDILTPLHAILQQLRDSAPEAPDSYVFTTPEGTPLDTDNLRNRIWYHTLEAAGLRKRTMYQCRHTFASLMLQNGEDPAWVSKTLGHTTLQMLYKHYGRYIKNRTRLDGKRFIKQFKSAKALSSPVVEIRDSR